MARPRLLHLLLALFVAALLWPIPGKSQQNAAPAAGEWRAYGANELSTRYSPLDQLNRDTVKNLQVAWTWKFDNYGTPAETVTTSREIGGRPPAARNIVGSVVTRSSSTMRGLVSVR